MKALFSLDGDLGHFLAAMAAIETFSKQNPKIKIDIAAVTQARDNILQGAWFVNKSFPTTLGNISNADQYDFVHLLEADIVTSKEAEIARRITTKNNIDSYIASIAKQRGLDPNTIQKPDNYERLDVNIPPMWNLVQGYAFNIEDSSGWKCRFLEETPPPWVNTTKTMKDIANRVLRSVDIKGEDFVVVDKYDWLIANGGDIAYPDNWKAITTDDLEDDIVIGLVTNPRCKLVVGPTGGAVYTAWASNKPLLEINQSSHTAYWDSCRAGNAVTILQENTSAVSQTMCAILEKRYGIHWAD